MSESKPALVALRDRRAQVIELLSQHFAEDVLELDEFERRVDLAHGADTVVGLDLLVKDLEVAPAPELASPTALAVRAETALQGASAPLSKKRVLAILGGSTRRGAWRVPRHLRVIAVLGGVQLDFRDVVLPPGETHVQVTALLGGVDIIVPPTLAVDAEGSAILGGFDDMGRAPRQPDPDEPLLRISGLAMLGGFSISTRLPGESERQARKRTRREGKQLAEQRRLQLGDGKKRTGAE